MFGINNLWIELPLFFWVMFQIPATVAICVLCISEAEYKKSSLLFWPLLISSLRSKLSIAGTMIAAVITSILFLPSILAYFVVGSFVGLIYLICIGFMALFKRKD